MIRTLVSCLVLTVIFFWFLFRHPEDLLITILLVIAAHCGYKLLLNLRELGGY